MEIQGSSGKETMRKTNNTQRIEGTGRGRLVPLLHISTGRQKIRPVTGRSGVKEAMADGNAQMPRLQRTDLRYYCHRGRARSFKGKVPRMREDSQIGMATTGHGDS